MKTIAFLQNDAFDANGNLNIDTNGRPVLVMVKASWCGHCVKAAPDFQAFADKHSGKIMCAVIREGDGQTPSEKTLMGRLNKILPSFRGFPHYILFVNGKPVDIDVKSRNVADLEQAIKKYV